MMINNKTVQDLSINGKTVQSIKDVTTDKIIYTKTDDVPIGDVLYDKIRHILVIPKYDIRIDEENDGTYHYSDCGGVYSEGDSISDVEYDIETLTPSVENDMEISTPSMEDYYIFLESETNMTLEEFYDYEYMADDEIIFDYGNGFYYNGYDTNLGALIFTESLSEFNGVLPFFSDCSTKFMVFDCSISNDDVNQVTVFTWTIPTSINSSFSFSNEGSVIGSDLDPNYDYIIVQRDGVIMEVLNSEKLETDGFFNLYDVDIYYCNSSDTEGITNAYVNSGESFKDFAENNNDVLFYYDSLKDMIRIDNVSSNSINITLHNFYTTGNYTCNARGLDDKAYYSNERIRTDPFSFQISSKYSLSFPVTIYLRDVYMELLQTKIVEFENSGGTPEK